MRPRGPRRSEIEVREVSPADARDQVLDLLARNGHWKVDTPGDLGRLWAWRTGSLGEEAPVMWMALAGDRLLGTLSLYPRTARLGDRVLRVAVPADLLVDQETRGVGLGRVLGQAFMKHLASEGYDIAISFGTVGGQATAGRSGFHRYGELSDMVDLVHTAELLRGRLPFPRLAAVSVDLALGIRRAVCQRSLGAVAALQLRRFEMGERLPDLDRSHWPPEPGLVVPWNSPDFLFRRFLSDPFQKRSLLTFWNREGRFEGYVVVEHRRTRRVVLECEANIEVGGAAALIARAARVVAQESPLVAVSLAPDSRLARSLHRLGFLHRDDRAPGRPPVTVGLYWSPSDRDAAIFEDLQSWRILLGESDA